MEGFAAGGGGEPRGPSGPFPDVVRELQLAQPGSLDRVGGVLLVEPAGAGDRPHAGAEPGFERVPGVLFAGGGREEQFRGLARIRHAASFPTGGGGAFCLLVIACGPSVNSTDSTEPELPDREFAGPPGD